MYALLRTIGEAGLAEWADGGVCATTQYVLNRQPPDKAKSTTLTIYFQRSDTVPTGRHREMKKESGLKSGLLNDAILYEESDSPVGTTTSNENRANLPEMSHYALRTTHYVLDRQPPYKAKSTTPTIYIRRRNQNGEE